MHAQYGCMHSMDASTPHSTIVSPHSTIVSPHSTIVSPHSTIVSPHSTMISLLSCRDAAYFTVIPYFTVLLGADGTPRPPEARLT